MLSQTNDPATLSKVRDPVEGSLLPNYLGQQAYYRALSEVALFTISKQNDIQFIARVDPYGNLAQQIDPIAVESGCSRVSQAL